MKKIKILGAGLSGLSAAINLAKAGYSVDIFDSNSDSGARFHGDLQGLENWSEKIDVLSDLKKMNIAINFDCDPFDEFFGIKGKTKTSFKFEQPIFYLVKRGSVTRSIDQGLKKQALELGVSIKYNRTIPREEADIVATGPITKAIGGAVKGIIFETTHPDIAIGIAENKVANGGYAYLLITKGYGCMCTAVCGNLEKMNDYFTEAKKTLTELVPFDIKNPKNVGGVGCFSFNNKFRTEKSLFVGEAAGLQDLLFGFGMRYAIISGYMAAQSIIKNQNYEKNAEKYFSKKRKAGIVNRYLWEKILSSRPYLLFFSRFLSKKYLYSFYNFNLIQKMLYPFALRHTKKRHSFIDS